MGRAARVALVVVVVVAVLCAGLGAGAAAALHWYVVQPSDDELRAVAAGLTLEGFGSTDGRDVSGAWAPSFERGEVHWDAVSERQVTVDDVADELRAQGWAVRTRATPAGGGTVHGERGRFLTWLTLLEGADGGTRASIAVGRGPASPPLGVTVGTGAGAGAVVGAVCAALLAAALARRAGRRGRR